MLLLNLSISQYSHQISPWMEIEKAFLVKLQAETFLID